MLRLFLLLPLVAAVPLKQTANNYVLDIEDGTLKNVQLKGDPISELNLSGMKLRALEKHVLDNLPDLTSLNLANNSLESLPEFVFSNMSKLEHLSLAENQISETKYLFVGLENLRILNISHNPVVHIRKGDLYGLSKTATIYTEGNRFWSISTDAFANIFLKSEEQMKGIEGSESTKVVPEVSETKSEDETMQENMEAEAPVHQTENAPEPLGKDVKLKLCVSDNIVTSLEALKDNEQLSEGCSEVNVEKAERMVSLSGLSIKGFLEGWYKLQSLPVASLDLSNNDISEITKEILNDLPENVAYVNLRENRISRIWSQVIENQHLKMLNLKDNIVSEIEAGALEKTKLTGLFLAGNQLENLNFVSSLPATLNQIVLVENRISSIPDQVFSKLTELVYLNLAENQITKLQNNVFKGLTSLEALDLTKNKLMEIESEAFNDLKKLTTLRLFNNELTDLKKDTFAPLEGLKDLSLSSNKLEKVTKDTFSGLPKSLDFLYIENNEIKSLESGSFVDVPRFTLSLTGNMLSNIPKGAFNLPTLQDLLLSNNTFTEIDGDSFEGLPQLKRLWLSDNKISEINKGACKNLGSLNIFDIAGNPFERLKKGALHGLSTAEGNYVYIYNNQLKEIEGGVFDDV